MPYIIKSDLYRSLYQETIDQITEGDDSIVTTAINGAIAETKQYLSRYDLVQLFGDDNATPPVVAFVDENLKQMVIDIAVWRLIKLSAPAMSYEHIRTCYEDAIRNLKDIQRGLSNPDGWPYKDTTGETTPPGDGLVWDSNDKRANYF